MDKIIKFKTRMRFFQDDDGFEEIKVAADRFKDKFKKASADKKSAVVYPVDQPRE